MAIWLACLRVKRLRAVWINQYLMRQAGQFTRVLKYVAGKLGKSVVFLDPKGTSQPGGNGFNKVPKEWWDGWHSCQGGESLAREENSAKLIKRLGLDYESGGASTSLKKALASREKEAWGLTVLRWWSGLFTESGDAEKMPSNRVCIQVRCNNRCPRDSSLIS